MLKVSLFLVYFLKWVHVSVRGVCDHARVCAFVFVCVCVHPCVCVCVCVCVPFQPVSIGRQISAVFSIQNTSALFA